MILSTRIVNRIILFSGIIIAMYSIIVMCSWTIEQELITNLFPVQASMKFNTALFFLLSAIVLIHKSRTDYSHWAPKLLIGGTVIITSFYTLAEYVIPGLPSVDNLIVIDHVTLENPGRMSPATATSFLLLMLGLIFVSSNNALSVRLGRFFINSISVLALTGIVGFILNLTAEDKLLFFTSMSLPTALFFFLASASISLKFQSLGIFGLLTRMNVGSRLFRRVLPVIILFPIVAASVTLFLTTNKYLTHDFAFVLFTVLFIVIVSIYIGMLSGELNKYDAHNKSLISDLRDANSNLSMLEYGINQNSMVVYTDFTGKILKANHKFCEVTKYKCDELIGATHAKVKSGAHDETFYRKMRETIYAGHSWNGEIQNLAKDGSTYWVDTSIVPIKGKDGNILKFIAISEDITLKKSEQQQERENYILQLEQKNAELEQFTRIAAHDLQEPLKTLQSFIQLFEIDSSNKLSPDGFTYLHYMNQSSRRMSRLISGLLEYSRIGNKAEMAAVDLNKMIDEIKEDLTTSIDLKHAEIVFKNLPTINCYPQLLKQVFQNILSNAVKFTPENVSPRIRIESQQRFTSYLISISDNGIGIEPKHLEKVFVIFERIKTRANYEGTGIGLAHAKKIIELHKGKIWVESEVGKGSTFYFELPKLKLENGQ